MTVSLWSYALSHYFCWVGVFQIQQKCRADTEKPMFTGLATFYWLLPLFSVSNSATSAKSHFCSDIILSYWIGTYYILTGKGERIDIGWYYYLQLLFSKKFLTYFQLKFFYKVSDCHSTTVMGLYWCWLGCFSFRCWRCPVCIFLIYDNASYF